MDNLKGFQRLSVIQFATVIVVGLCEVARRQL